MSSEPEVRTGGPEGSLILGSQCRDSFCWQAWGQAASSTAPYMTVLDEPLSLPFRVCGCEQPGLSGF